MAKKTIKVPKVVDGVPSEVEIEVDDTAGPSWGPKEKHRLLNTRLPRADGPVKATGAAVYTFDVALPGMLQARFLCSSRARAKVTNIDTAPAEKISGVKAVIAFGDNSEVRFAGQPIAVVAASTVEIAEDAVRAIRVQYENMPHVVKADDALSPDAPKIFDAPTVEKKGDPAAVAEALKGCDAVVEAEYRSPTLHHNCLETHGVVVDYRGRDEATVYCSTQACSSIPGDAAKALGLKASNVKCIVYHMGGGFGSKFGIGPAGQWACELAKKLKVPIKLMLTRSQEYLMAGNGPGAIQRFKAGASKDGTLVAVHCEQFGLGGIGSRGRIAQQPYQYEAQKVYVESRPVFTNEDSSVALRAPGHPQASFAMESIMDDLAYKLGIDPIEFRKKNLKKDKEKKPQEAWVRQLDRGAREIGWERHNKTPGGAAGTKRRGMGCAIGAWGGGGGPACVVTVKVGQDGLVSAEVGSQDLGTGTRSYVRAIVAEELGLPYDAVVEKIGDSSLGNANPSGGSTTAASLAPAVKDAAYNARLAVAEKVAPLLGGDAKSVVFMDGNVAAPGKSLTWKQACAALPATGLSVRGEWKRELASSGAHGVTFAEVEVDMETGHVRPIKMVHVQDGGLPLNRAGFESQLNGGMIQSLGMALWEGRVMDAQLGLMLNDRFEEYKLVGSREMPEMVPIIDDGDTRSGVMGVAEPANIPGAAAVANAVFNACGARIYQLPITPDKVLNALMKQDALMKQKEGRA